jgi:hypothetical protein
MSDKKIIMFVFSSLILTAGYQLYSLDQNESRVAAAATRKLESVTAVECEDCLSSTSDYCELETNTCIDDPLCNEWLSCTEDCIALSMDKSCFDDCDSSHADLHNECSSFKTCACVVCIGQCTNMCASED